MKFNGLSSGSAFREESSTKDLYIIGAGGFGREAAWLVERINEAAPTWNLKGFIDDNEALWNSSEGKYPVLGGCDYLKSLGKVSAVCAVGTAGVRKRIVEQLENSEVAFATIIDPSVLVSDRTAIGRGSIICAGSIVTVDARIGSHVILNLDCTVGHDAVLGDYVTVYPGVNISGNVEIGACSEVGTGSQIIQGKKTAPDVVIGAGAVVVKDLMESGTYVGSPARKIK